MENLEETIQNSILSVKQKTLPTTHAPASVGTFEGVVKLHALYDFFGLDFSQRTGRETLELQKKLRDVQEYLDENYDDTSAGLRDIEQKLGNKPLDKSLLDHVYHHIKYKNEVFKSRPKEEQEVSYQDKIKEANSQIEALRLSISETRQQVRSAKELERTQARIARMEERRTLIEAKAKALVESLNVQPETSPTA